MAGNEHPGLELLRSRRSVSKLVEPAPSDTELEDMIRHAAMAPDHKELRPWRFLVIRGTGLSALGDVLAEGLLRRDANATQGQLEKERSKPLRAPLIVAVVAKRLETKLAFSELVAATDAATQNLLLAATAYGYGSIWRTGAPVSDPFVKRSLGLQPDDELVAFVYIGTPDCYPPDRKPTNLDEIVLEWP